MECVPSKALGTEETPKEWLSLKTLEVLPAGRWNWTPWPWKFSGHDTMWFRNKWPALGQARWMGVAQSLIRVWGREVKEEETF